MYNIDWEVLFTSADGTQRRSVPREYLLKPSGRILRYGGYGPATYPTLFDETDQSIPILIGDRVEAVYQGNVVHRSYVTALVASEANPRTITAQTEGAMFWAQKLATNRQFAYPYGSVDVSVVFADFVNYLQTVVGIVGPQGVTNFIPGIDAQTIGVEFFSVLNAIYAQSGDVLSSIVKATGNLAVWGIDRDPIGRNRWYIRPFASGAPGDPQTRVFSIPARNISVAQSERQSADVVNVLNVSGGAVLFPQLVHNGNFELPVSNQDGAGNLVHNGSFEPSALTPAGDGWTGNNTGTSGPRQSVLVGVIHTVPYVGQWMYVLTPAGSFAQQVRSPGGMTAGHQWVLSLWAQKSIDLQPASGHMQLKIYAGAAGTGTLLLDSGNITVNPSSNAYSRFAYQFTMPALAVSFVLIVQVDAVAGNGASLNFDNVDLYDVQAVNQDGWELVPGSDPTINATNWAYTVEQYDGSYAVYADVTCPTPNTDGHDVGFLPGTGIVSSFDPQAKFQSYGGQSVRLSCFAKSPTISTPNPNFPGVLLIIDWYNGNAYISESRTYYSPPGGTYATWQYLEMVATAPPNATTGYPRVILRTTGSIVLDCISLRDAQAPSMNPNAGPVTIGGQTVPGNSAGPVLYQREGNYQGQIRCDDNYLLNTYLPSQGRSSTPPYRNSINTYGLLVGSLDQQAIIDQSSMCAIADAVFTSQGLEVARPVIRIDMDPNDLYTGPFWPGNAASLQGQVGPYYSPVPIPIVETSWEYDGLLSFEVQAQREKPDDSIATTKLILNLMRTQGTGGGSSYGAGGYSNPGTGGGGAGGGTGISVTDGTTTVAATVLKFLRGSVSNPSPGEADYTLSGSLTAVEWFTATGPGYTTPALGHAATAVLLVFRSRSTLETTDYSFASNQVTVAGARNGDVIGVLYNY